MQRYVKKGESSRFRNDDKNQHEFSPKDENPTSQRLQIVIEKIKTITGGPFTGESFRSLKKTSQRQVNSVHMKPPFQRGRC